MDRPDDVIVTPEQSVGSARATGHPHARDELLKAAQRVLARKGPTASVEEIMAESGLSVSYFYSYFDTRFDLLNEAADRALAEFERRMFACTQDLPHPAEILAARVRMFGRMVKTDEMTARLVVLNHGERLGRLTFGFPPDALSDLERAMGAGQLRCRDPASALLVLTGGCVVLMSGLLDEDAIEVGALFEDFVATTFVMLGLTPQAAFELSRRPLPTLPPPVPT